MITLVQIIVAIGFAELARMNVGEGKIKYVSLHTHSTYSYGDGFGSVKDHVNRIADLGMNAIALTEHGNVSSWVALEKACKATSLSVGREIKPIFGVESYTSKPEERRKCHMILLAANEEGLQNLNRIVSQSWRDFYQFPTVLWNTLKDNANGIIALSGCADSYLSCTLLGGKYLGEKRMEFSDKDFQRAVRYIQQMQDVFGERFYLETQRFPGLERTCVLNPALEKLSAATGSRLVATCDVHYPKPNDNAMQRILHAAHRGMSVETADADWEYNILLTYPQTDKEIFNDLVGTGLSKEAAKTAILSTEEIANFIEVELPKAPPVSFGVPDAKAVLRQWISDGWKKRSQENEFIKLKSSEYKARVNHEFQTICDREGFADYFLIVADIVQWAKDQGIAVGPGRGSSAGSLVCYLLRITEIDSLQYPMLFERFLDPTRTDPPDIDIDFEDTRRDEVFAYATTKYGQDRVANIGTFTRYKGKNSLDDIGRVYHIPKWKLDAVKGKLLERSDGHPRASKTLEDTYNSFSDVADLVESTAELSFAPRLEGNLRGFGVHAAGMVISSVPLNNICATYERTIGERQGSAIAFDKYDSAYLGLLKIDALSLLTMGMVAKVCELAGISLTDLYRVPLDDEKTWAAFKKGSVLGIFQFEGNTTRRILKAVEPQNIMQLSDVNALSRPGANDRAYLENKEILATDTGTIHYPHPIVAQHLSWTNGVIVYEEQILMILRDLGGFAPAELNRMRKIIHDKLGSTQFNEYLERFVKGAAAHGLSEDTAKSVWDTMVGASGYAFNIAHSVAYSHIGYWQQYLKTRYPAEFFTGQLLKCSNDDNGKVRRQKLIQEAMLHGIDVMPPNLLDSQQDWTFTKPERNGNGYGYSAPTILAGFTIIPGIGPKTAENIINWRENLIGDGLVNIDEDGLGMEWSDLIDVKGIGQKTIEKISEFVSDPDLFGVNYTKRVLDETREALSNGMVPGFPAASHNSIDIQTDGRKVCFAGIVRRRKYYDAVEQLKKRVTEEISTEDALRQLDDPHLLKYVALQCEDEYGETINVRVSRWRYPAFQKMIDNLRTDTDIVVAVGKTSDFGGVSIQVSEMIVLEP